MSTEGTLKAAELIEYGPVSVRKPTGCTKAFSQPPGRLNLQKLMQESLKHHGVLDLRMPATAAVIDLLKASNTSVPSCHHCISYRRLKLCRQSVPHTGCPR